MIRTQLRTESSYIFLSILPDLHMTGLAPLSMDFDYFKT